MDEIRVGSWVDLQEQLFAEMWKAELGLHRSHYAFRGRNDARDDLATSLARLGGDAAALEGHLLRNFRKYAGPGAVPADSPWNWLALGQHHGLPTRLLDWTNSPHVALHFATSHSDEFARDGAVWMVDYVGAHELAPAPIRECLEREGAVLLTTELLASVAHALDDLGRLGEDFVAFFEPPSFDERIVNRPRPRFAAEPRLGDAELRKPTVLIDLVLERRPTPPLRSRLTIRGRRARTGRPLPRPTSRQAIAESVPCL